MHHNHTSSPIHFYDLDKPYGEFGNFYPAPIQLDGFIWPTNEHYFQAQKFAYDINRVIHISQLSTPREVFDYAQYHRSAVRPDWENIKDKVMFRACMAKFTQHPQLKYILLSTGHRTLVEHTKNDSYWGDGGNGTGQNRLGITLMQVREVIRQHQ
ncbi:unnamed protein product [Adineta steineri]|uniref:NADAR domain-containing protein n=1 Tax=Adineta steineri TaxID=433720 RepID=A0A819PAZ0_9BILA|nr:unnamed protein product [Adineta steineri]